MRRAILSFLFLCLLGSLKLQAMNITTRNCSNIHLRHAICENNLAEVQKILSGLSTTEKYILIIDHTMTAPEIVSEHLLSYSKKYRNCDYATTLELALRSNNIDILKNLLGGLSKTEIYNLILAPKVSWCNTSVEDDYDPVSLLREAVRQNKREALQELLGKLDKSQCEKLLISRKVPDILTQGLFLDSIEWETIQLLFSYLDEKQVTDYYTDVLSKYWWYRFSGDLCLLLLNHKKFELLLLHLDKDCGFKLLSTPLSGRFLKTRDLILSTVNTRYKRTLLNESPKSNALWHLACAYGHPEIIPAAIGFVSKKYPPSQIAQKMLALFNLKNSANKTILDLISITDLRSVLSEYKTFCEQCERSYLKNPVFSALKNESKIDTTFAFQ